MWLRSKKAARCRKIFSPVTARSGDFVICLNSYHVPHARGVQKVLYPEHVARISSGRSVA
jgi:hypothetical protein